LGGNEEKRVFLFYLLYNVYAIGDKRIKEMNTATHNGGPTMNNLKMNNLKDIAKRAGKINTANLTKEERLCLWALIDTARDVDVLLQMLTRYTKD